jgi:flavin reductase (DIM6/NTAB) family NADH-FMN oxidoreductase RutF
MTTATNALQHTATETDATGVVIPLSSGEVTPDEFKAAFRHHPGGVSLITADAGEGPVALTVTSVFSVSVTPPLLVFSVSELSSSTPTIRKTDTVVVHLLSADELTLAKLGATSGIDRFADTSLWSRLESGEPYFPAAHAWIRGRIVNRMEVGGSTVIAVQALQTSGQKGAAENPTNPLVYYNRTWHQLGEHSVI